MTTRINLARVFAGMFLLMGIAFTMTTPAVAALPRPQGPCDIYAAAGDPCVAAHSTTRALYASYNGPLYQILRQSDGKTLDIGVVQPTLTDAGGYADAAAQDTFCANTYCWITTLYDQSPRHNNLTQPPRGAFNGPALGGFDNLPIADMAPITVLGHKAYGIFIEPGMGLRDNDAKGTAVDDQAEGQYWVINGLHFNSGCCFDYGNAETDSRDDGNGTMETAYFGDSTPWYHGNPPGPWVMTDQENNLVGCANPDGSKLCASLPNITWRFVTAMAKGEPHHWTSMGGNAQQGTLQVMFNGPRINPTYDPMRKQGAILLGNGGDNSDSSQGTFYEGAMTASGTFPADATDQQVQANIVSAGYGTPFLSLAPASASATPPGLQTFSPRSSQDTTVTFTNSTTVPVSSVRLSIALPTKQWSVVLSGTTETSKTFVSPVAPGASVNATFKVTSGPVPFNGDLIGEASWTSVATGKQLVTIAEKVRNVLPVKINEFSTSAANPFIELYNASAHDVDLSNWTLTERPTQQAMFSTITVPAGTHLSAGGFYLLGLSNSGLAVSARAGEATLSVRSTAGMAVGDAISIDTGSAIETHAIASLGSAASNNTTLWQPLPDGPVITIPAGSTNVPVANVAGFAIGEKIALGYGATYPAVARGTERYEVATVTAIGKPGTQAYLAADAPVGATNIKVTSVANISVGDTIRLDIDSVGHGIETVTVTHVGTQATRGASDRGTGLDLAAPLRFTHASNMPFSDRGTGITFQPATAFAHSSNEPVQALGTGITVDKPLAKDHAIDAVVHDAKVTGAGHQGTPAPNQWFGGPALSPSAGSMVLRDVAGLVVDSLNYGLLVDPWAAEGYQATSGSTQRGCAVVAPRPGTSAGRLRDGLDTGSNCTDFLTQAVAALAAPSAAGTTNVKVGSTEGFDAGQTVTIDAGANLETAVIATVGTAGASTVGFATSVGATTIPVSSPSGFTVGQTITIGSGSNSETAIVASASRRGTVVLTVASPLTLAHAAGAQVSGTGITLTAALARAHASGTQVAGNLPTPGSPNQYGRRAR